MWVVLQPKVCLRERYWDMRPSCSEASALADVGNGSKVFFALLLRLMLTLLPEGPSLALSGNCPGSSFRGGGKVVGL